MFLFILSVLIFAMFYLYERQADDCMMYLSKRTLVATHGPKR